MPDRSHPCDTINDEIAVVKWSRPFGARFPGQCTITGLPYTRDELIRLVDFRRRARCPVLERAVVALEFRSTPGLVAATRWRLQPHGYTLRALLGRGLAIELIDLDHRTRRIAPGLLVEDRQITDDDLLALIEGSYAWLSEWPTADSACTSPEAVG